MTQAVQTENIELELSAVIVSVNGFEKPEVLLLSKSGQDLQLPAGPFDPVHHATLELGLRGWIMEQTPFTPGYVEQLYTFGNRGRVTIKGRDAKRVVSVGYLALAYREDTAKSPAPAQWVDWYRFFPWEDWRNGRPQILDTRILPALGGWIESAETREDHEDRSRRCAVCFTSGGGMEWDHELVLERYELLYSARLVPEVFRDKGEKAPPSETLVPGRPMRHDHRRILATAIGRLRGKIKYRPVIFELMPEQFTLLQLQKSIEAIGGYRLHKQNFRRLLENNRLVEETGDVAKKTGGRPAAMFQFRKEILSERVAIGVKMSPSG